MSVKSIVDPVIFQAIQDKIDKDSAFHDELREIVQQLNKQTRATLATLSRIHGMDLQSVTNLLSLVQTDIAGQVETIQKLASKASTQPYYKWNNVWTRSVQDACYTIILTEWLRDSTNGESDAVKLLTLEEVGETMHVPTNVKDRDGFHLAIEEYLLALVSLIDELARLARNAVTVGNYKLPIQISSFIKNVHEGFQLLNLKNDILRKRSDGIKYRVKEVEDVVYDLSLRGLLPKSGQ